MAGSGRHSQSGNTTKKGGKKGRRGEKGRRKAASLTTKHESGEGSSAYAVEGGGRREGIAQPTHPPDQATRLANSISLIAARRLVLVKEALDLLAGEDEAILISPPPVCACTFRARRAVQDRRAGAACA